MSRYSALAVLASVFSLASAGSYSVHLLAQNVQMIHLVGGSESEQVARGERIVPRILADADLDVVGFTETFLDEPSDVLKKKLKGKFPHILHKLPASPRFPKLIHSGLMLMSRFPIVKSRFAMFTESSGLDSFSAKGVIVALLQLPRGHIVVALTHQQAGGSEAVYLSQLSTIRDTVRSFVKANVPLDTVNSTGVVLMGDMNIRYLEDGSPTARYKLMLDTVSAGTVDPHAKLYPDDPGNTSPARSPRSRIDYLFQLQNITGGYVFAKAEVTEIKVSKLVTADLASDDHLSDHLGIAATMEIAESNFVNLAPPRGLAGGAAAAALLCAVLASSPL